MKSENLNKILVVVLLISFLAFGAYFAKESGAFTKETIDVSGTATITSEPNEVVIHVGVETRAKNAKDAKEQNAEIMSRVQNALKLTGLSEKEYETTNYYLHEEYDWSDGRSEIIGYIASHDLKIKTKDLDKIGSYIDVAADAGINKMYGINFQLSSELESEKRKEALRLATENAQERAEELAFGLGRSLGKVIQISDTSMNYRPYLVGMRMEDIAKAESSEIIQTNIVSGNVEVTASVSATYQLK